MIAAALLLLMQAAPAGADDRATRCYREEVSGGSSVMTYIGDRACLPLRAPETMEGIWLNEFEGSRFVRDAKIPEDVGHDQRDVWLNRHEPLRPGAKVPPFLYGRAFRVKFVGRTAPPSSGQPLDGYGHMGMSRGLVVVDEWVEAVDIGPTSAFRRPRPPNSGNRR